MQKPNYLAIYTQLENQILSDEDDEPLEFFRYAVAAEKDITSIDKDGILPDGCTIRDAVNYGDVHLLDVIPMVYELRERQSV
jgi:hypothetical protein